VNSFRFTTFFYSLTCAAFLVVSSCQSIEDLLQRLNVSQASSFQVSESGLAFVGVSPIYSSRDRSIQTALEDAARRLSFFGYVSGHITRTEQVGSSVFAFHVDQSYALQYDNDFEKYVDQLEVIDVFEEGNAIFVNVRAGTSASVPQYRGHSSGRRPRWINSVPVIDGYLVGVGNSARLSSHADTVRKSYENAVIGIIENIAIQVNSAQGNYENISSVFGFDMFSSNVSSAFCTLSGFYIIESWTDPSNFSVWTLAVARGGN
jgi:hypothetical protein